MNTPETILYQGQRYVRAAKKKHPGPSCPNNQHWNHKHRKCMPLPHGVQRAYDAAKHHTYIANDRQRTKQEDLMQGHIGDYRHDGHKTAEKANEHAAKLALKHGFKHLHRKLMNRSARHMDMASRAFGGMW